MAWRRGGILISRNIMTQTKLSHKVFQDPKYFVAFGFGAGLLPAAPGTWGTLIAMLLYIILSACSPLWYALIVLLGTALGIWVSEIVTKDLGVKDYKGIVWDEIIGYLITMFYVPFGIIWMLLGFALFRFFDVLKPFPLSWVDKHVHGGFGIMLDDILAGILACFCLHLLGYFGAYLS